MASIERTAYPRFRRVVSAQELAGLTPTADDVAWARAHSRTDEHLLALVLSLRCFGRLGYFPSGEDVPDAVVDHVRRCLEREDATAVCGAATAKLHRTLVRERLVWSAIRGARERSPRTRSTGRRWSRTIPRT
jgi:Domain of unknown function (DUF4158)